MKKKVFYPTMRLTVNIVKLDCLKCLSLPSYMKPYSIVEVIPQKTRTHRYCSEVRFPGQQNTDIVCKAFLHDLKTFKALQFDS
jgi:transcriptional regulator of met regulon